MASPKPHCSEHNPCNKEEQEGRNQLRILNSKYTGSKRAYRVNGKKVGTSENFERMVATP